MHTHLLVKIISELHAVSHLSSSYHRNITADARIFFFLGILYAREITRGNMIPEPVEFVALGANQVSEM